MKRHFAKFAQEMAGSVYWPGPGARVIEIGCNDGSLISRFKNLGALTVGIDPAANVLANAKEAGVEVMEGFFGPDTSIRIRSAFGAFDLVVAANVICHIPDLRGLGLGIDTILGPKGVFVFEEPYWGDVFRLASYDQFYDEHVFMFSCESVAAWATTFGFELVDAQHQITHGGSMRYFLARSGEYGSTDRVAQYLEWERRAGINQIANLRDFATRVSRSREDLTNLIGEARRDGKDIWAYAATSKSTTIFNYCGFTQDDISAICDSTLQKQGRYSPGSNIPVVPIENFHKVFPELTFLSAWNHASEIWSKEYQYVTKRGQWITHVPRVRIVNPSEESVID
jgi:methylation protein EvaC